MFEPSLERSIGMQDEPEQEISLEDTPVEELGLTEEQRAQEEWRLLTGEDNEKLQERIRLASQSPDLQQAQAAIINLARTAKNELEVLEGVTPLIKQYDPLVLWVGLNRYNNYQDDEESICHIIGKLLLETSTAFHEAKTNPTKNGESISTREDKKRRLEQNLEFLVNIPKEKQAAGYFHTIDFLEDIVGVINKYDHDLVQESVKEFVKDPKHDEQACGMLLTLADLPRAERDNFLEDRRHQLTLSDMTHSGERKIVKTQEPTESNASSSFADPPEEERTLIDSLPKAKIEPIATRQENVRRSSADIAKQIQSQYGHTVEALIDNPSLAAWPKGEEPKLAQKFFGFFRKLAGGPPDPRVLELIDDWKIAKLQEEKPATTEEMKARRPQVGYLSRRTGTPSAGLSLGNTASERRGALTTLGGYEQQETVEITRPELLLRKINYSLAKIASEIISIDSKTHITSIELNALKHKLDEAYHQLDIYRPIAEKTSDFKQAMEFLNQLYAKYNDFAEAVEGPYTNEDREQEPERVKARKKGNPEVTVNWLLRNSGDSIDIINNLLTTYNEKNKGAEKIDPEELVALKNSIDSTRSDLENLRLNLGNDRRFKALLNQIGWAEREYDKLTTKTAPPKEIVTKKPRSSKRTKAA